MDGNIVFCNHVGKVENGQETGIECKHEVDILGIRDANFGFCKPCRVSCEFAIAVHFEGENPHSVAAKQSVPMLKSKVDDLISALGTFKNSMANLIKKGE